MNKFLSFIVLTFLVSCTSNTIYKEPKDLIPKDTMIALLTDMYLASSAKNIKNKFLKKESNYMVLVYNKYKIDTIRFDRSNKYYTSKADDYSDMLKKVKKNIDSLDKKYRELQRVKDSIDKPNSKLMLDEDGKTFDSSLVKGLGEEKLQHLRR
ncbi:DUF4296 domain-containing protein [Tenacibaculum sp. TC6]|uniref:DUF4296 domain-containing protein n=1 Tax=Tenacibaculum sp. TC6 TaxID=3423223 RepID=UPI003D368867